MKQKIVMKVPANDAKSRCKAMKAAAGIQGVISATLGGNDNDHLAMVGDRVDSVALAELLRKKLGFTEIISIAPVDENTKKKDEEGGGEKKDKGGGGMGGGSSGKKDKPDDSEKKDKEGGGRSDEKNDKANGELKKMGANKVYCGWFTLGPGTCAEAVLDEPKQGKWLLTVVN